ncbi:cyclin-I-like [Biomphalaria glabrata]|uniref:Cyclin-I-like n=1 Tax=Biomphalaria glabrata TaxID=6526 RepID=A0A2C9KL82_BIOGL|nr:cyclin-I-like [Biomphalaria glabrata]
MDRLFMSGLDARQAMHMISSYLDKECRFWKPMVIKSSPDQGINEMQRDEAAVWIAKLSAEFTFLPETCGLAILLMDRVLQLVKVRAKYLQCVAVTCLHIAAKTLEEDENIPPTPYLVRKSCCGCSFAEITRMEMVILNKLNWNVLMPSSVDFLHMIHVVLLMHYPHLLTNQSNMGPSEHLSIVMRKMIRCLTCHSLNSFRPSSIALALISLELEQLTPGWLRLVLTLQRVTNVGSEQLMQCREAIADFLGQQIHTGYHYQSRKSSSSAPQSKKRKVEHSTPDSEDENMYDGIKRLYNEDLMTNAGTFQFDKAALRTSCGFEMHQDFDETTMGKTLLVN